MSNLADLKVLVIDDMEDLLLFHRLWMNREKIKVLTSITGEHGLSQLRDNPDIDVALVDMTLPDMNGLEVFKAMRILKPGLPVILCSGYFENTSQLDGQQNVLLLNKPFCLPTLKNIVGSMAGR